jgi:protein-tyrosine phosphatase
VADGHTPALVHCAAGKDRTGITVAVLLAAAGVEEADIVADYVVTGLRLDRVRAALSRRGGYPEDMVIPEPAPLDAAPIEGVLAALADLGGAAAYLRDHGATEAELATWRSLVIE